MPPSLTSDTPKLMVIRGDLAYMQGYLGRVLFDNKGREDMHSQYLVRLCHTLLPKVERSLEAIKEVMDNE